MPGAPRRNALALAVACGVVLPLAGCAFGPKMLERTHGRYNEAIRRVDEEQLLRNLIHIRYNESPAELDVASIAAQYELSGQAEARPFFSTEATGNLFRSFTTILPAALFSGANRPTMSLIPADDSDAVRRFLTPIPTDTLAFLTETGWPPTVIMRLWVERVNGVPNGVRATGPQRELAPGSDRFRRIAELLQLAQVRELGYIHAAERTTEVSGPLPAQAVTAAAVAQAAKDGLEFRPVADGKSWVLVRRQRGLVFEINPGAEWTPEVTELAGLLNLVPGQRSYPVVVAGGRSPDPLLRPTPPSSNVRVLTRSTAQVYSFLANGVDVPAEHLKCGVARPIVDDDGGIIDGSEVTGGLFAVRVCHGHRPPPNAYLAVRYRGYWYYLDDRDQESKATFSLILQLSRLDFTRQRTGGPVLTLPVGK